MTVRIGVHVYYKYKIGQQNKTANKTNCTATFRSQEQLYKAFLEVCIRCHIIDLNDTWDFARAGKNSCEFSKLL